MSSPTKTHHLDLAQKIMDIALDMGFQQGERLVETNLAKACHVSRTPVRTALKLLDQLGLAVKSAEGGYLLACDPASAWKRVMAQHGNAEQELIEMILRDRSGRRLAQRITVSELMRRYKVSRKLVQKSLELLQEQTLVTRAAGQSWILSPGLDDAAVRQQSYEYRILLEPQAILSEGFSLDVNRAAMVRRQTEALLAAVANSIDLGAFQKVDNSFHDLIARSAGNRFVSESLLAHNHLRRLPGAIARMSDYRMRTSLQEHLKILAFLESEQFEVAADLMRFHLRASSQWRPSLANRGAPALVRPFAMALISEKTE